MLDDIERNRHRSTFLGGGRSSQSDGKTLRGYTRIGRVPGRGGIFGGLMVRMKRGSI